MSSFQSQLAKMRNQPGFIAALDQSGGSTPKALMLYGHAEGDWKNEDEMFALVHNMRTRVITSPAFDGKRILGAILFEGTMDRAIEGRPSADYLWNVKQVVPILKIDKGLATAADGVQLMKPMPDLDSLLKRAKENGIFGTKMRSVIKEANPAGVSAIVKQQFEYARKIIAAGFVPIVEPEVDIHCKDKLQAEKLMKAGILQELNALAANQDVILKLTLPSEDNFFQDLIHHPRVVRVVALSGGYDRDKANGILARNKDMVASFSRALLEGLFVHQNDAEFNQTLDKSIESIFRASTIKTA